MCLKNRMEVGPLILNCVLSLIPASHNSYMIEVHNHIKTLRFEGNIKIYSYKSSTQFGTRW